VDQRLSSHVGKIRLSMLRAAKALESMADGDRIHAEGKRQNHTQLKLQTANSERGAIPIPEVPGEHEPKVQPRWVQ